MKSGDPFPQLAVITPAAAETRAEAGIAVAQTSAPVIAKATRYRVGRSCESSICRSDLTSIKNSVSK